MTYFSRPLRRCLSRHGRYQHRRCRQQVLPPAVEAAPYDSQLPYLHLLQSEVVTTANIISCCSFHSRIYVCAAAMPMSSVVSIVSTVALISVQESLVEGRELATCRSGADAVLLDDLPLPRDESLRQDYTFEEFDDAYGKGDVSFSVGTTSGCQEYTVQDNSVVSYESVDGEPVGTYNSCSAENVKDPFRASFFEPVSQVWVDLANMNSEETTYSLVAFDINGDEIARDTVTKRNDRLDVEDRTSFHRLTVEAQDIYDVTFEGLVEGGFNRGNFDKFTFCPSDNGSCRFGPCGK